MAHRGAGTRGSKKGHHGEEPNHRAGPPHRGTPATIRRS